MKTRIGLVGGSFNPIHNAHIQAALKFKEAMQLDSCIFMPAYVSPFKLDSAEASSVTAIHRLNCVKACITKYSGCSVSSYEIDKAEVSYTYDTIKHLKALYSDAELYFLIGADSAVNFNKWRNWREILLSAQICIVPRPDSGIDYDKISEELSCGNRTPVYIEFPLMNISSTEIRLKIKNGLQFEESVPVEVAEYISKHKLYK